jgi:hypothetical protein
MIISNSSSKSTVSGSALWSKKSLAHCLINPRKSSIVPGSLTRSCISSSKRGRNSLNSCIGLSSRRIKNWRIRSCIGSSERGRIRNGDVERGRMKSRINLLPRIRWGVWCSWKRWRIQIMRAYMVCSICRVSPSQTVYRRARWTKGGGQQMIMQGSLGLCVRIWHCKHGKNVGEGTLESCQPSKYFDGGWGTNLVFGRWPSFIESLKVNVMGLEEL